MLKAIWLAMLPMLLSKKFQMGVLAMIAQLAARYGFGFDAEAAWAFVSPLIAAVIGQGIADHGKEAALIAATSNVATKAAA